MKIISERDLTYSKIKRHEFNISDCTVEEAKEFLIQKKEEMKLNAVCCNIFNDGLKECTVDYAPFGEWGLADQINGKYEFKLIGKI